MTKRVAFRNLITKVKAYCHRFKSVLVRTVSIEGFYFQCLQPLLEIHLLWSAGSFAMMSQWKNTSYRLLTPLKWRRASLKRTRRWKHRMQRRRARLSCVATSPALRVFSSFWFCLQELPAPEQKPLMALPNAEAAGGGPGLPLPAPGSIPSSDGADIKNNLEKFTESLHHKASQVTAWVMQLSEASTPRAAKLLWQHQVTNAWPDQCSSSTLASS